MTETLNAIARLPVECIANGMALNLKFTPVDGDAGKMLDDFVWYVKGYFDGESMPPMGGMEIQFNVAPHDEFIAVVKDPSSEEHQRLLVRVSGYTAYFKDLTPLMKMEIIDRTEYRLSTGLSVAFPPFDLTEGNGDSP